MSEKETFVEPTLTPLFTEQQIAARITELGQEIAKEYQNRPLILVTVLKGSFVFAADLSRAIYSAQVALGLPGSSVTCEFLGLSSYDYCGFRIGKEFVVGYGLDYKQRYRNLPWIGVLRL